MEANARNEAQVRVQRLLQQNADLLQHISLLVKQIQELEIKASGRFPSSEFSHLHSFMQLYRRCRKQLPVSHGSHGRGFSCSLLRWPVAACFRVRATRQQSLPHPRRIISSALLESLLSFLVGNVQYSEQITRPTLIMEMQLYFDLTVLRRSSPLVWSHRYGDLEAS